MGTTDNQILCDAPLLRKKQINNGLTVLLPDDSTMKATHDGTLNMPSFPTKEIIAFTFPSITKSLLSILAMCNEGVDARFMEKEVHVTCKGSII